MSIFICRQHHWYTPYEQYAALRAVATQSVCRLCTQRVGCTDAAAAAHHKWQSECSGCGCGGWRRHHIQRNIAHAQDAEACYHTGTHITHHLRPSAAHNGCCCRLHHQHGHHNRLCDAIDADCGCRQWQRFSGGCNSGSHYTRFGLFAESRKSRRGHRYTASSTTPRRGANEM